MTLYCEGQQQCENLEPGQEPLNVDFLLFGHDSSVHSVCHDVLVECGDNFVQQWVEASEQPRVDVIRVKIRLGDLGLP